MANQELLNYLKQFLATGQGTEAAKKVLLGVGWSEADIDAGIKELQSVSSQPAASSIQGQSNVQQSPVGSFQPQAVNFHSQGAHTKKKIVFVLIVTLLVLSGGGAYAYFYVLDTASPDEILTEAFSNFSAVKSLSGEATINLNIPQEPIFFGQMVADGSMDENKNFPVSVKLKAKGEFDVQNALKLKGSESIELDVEYGGAKLNANFDVLFVENKLYFKVKKLPEVLAEKMGIDSSLVLNKWIVADYSEGLSSYGAMGGGMFVAPQDILSNFQFSEERLKSITQALYGIFKVKEDLGSEEIGGVKSYHYVLGVDKEMVKKVFVEYWKLMLPATQELTEEDEAELIEMMSGGMEGFFSYAEKSIVSEGLEIWIGKKDKLPVKMALDIKVDDKDFGIKADFSFVGSYSDFNKPVEVTEPDDVVSFEELMKNLGAGATSGPLAEMRDSTRFSDLSILNSVLALYLSDVAGTKICESKKTIYASAPIKTPAGWAVGRNLGLRGVDGGGWLPINFNKISTGAPIESLPVDPINDATKKMIYLFACDPSRNTYEFNAIVQSEKYKGSMTNDGGDDPAVYEIGTEPGLDIIPKGFWSGILAL